MNKKYKTYKCQPEYCEDCFPISSKEWKRRLNDSVLELEMKDSKDEQVIHPCPSCGTRVDCDCGYWDSQEGYFILSELEEEMKEWEDATIYDNWDAWEWMNLV